MGIALATGILTMLATGSPFPPANIPAHGGRFLLAAALAKALDRGSAGFSVPVQLGILAATLLLSWTLFALVTWAGLANSWLGYSTPGFMERSREFLGVGFGQGLVAWWVFGFVTVGIPSFVIGVILLPLLYRAVQPALLRQGMLPASRGASGA